MVCKCLFLSNCLQMYCIDTYDYKLRSSEENIKTIGFPAVLPSVQALGMLIEYQSNKK